MEQQWNEIDRGKPTTRRKTCPSANLSTTNPTWTDPGSNPGLRSERPETNSLSHGTAKLVTLLQYSLMNKTKYLLNSKSRSFGSWFILRL
jgi:hypothetical protein